MSISPEKILAVYEANQWRIKRPDQLSRMELRMLGTWGAGKRKWQERAECRICGFDMPTRPDTPIDKENAFSAILAMPVTVCDSCEGMAKEHYADPDGQPEQKTGDWEKTCPPLFRKMIEAEIQPHYTDDKALRRVTSWRPTAQRGMIILGDSGTGKTLSLWAMKRNVERDGYRCDIYTAVEITRELSKHAKNLDAAIHLWRTKVLCIDDLGKEPITPAASALFWELIDRRYQAQVPTVITTRFRGEAFTERFKEASLGHDIRRRILDSCDPVRFKGPAADNNENQQDKNT